MKNNLSSSKSMNMNERKELIDGIDKELESVIDSFRESELKKSKEPKHKRKLKKKKSKSKHRHTFKN